MHVVNVVFGGIVGAVLWPFRSLGPWPGLVAVSLLTALLMLEVYKLTSNQSAIRRAKDRIKAHLLEMRLYQDNLRVTLRAQGAILRANLTYLAANLKPLAVMIAPLVLILAQLSVWYDRAPLRTGEEALVKVRFENSVDPLTLDLALETPPAVEVTAPVVRIADEHEAVWRIKAVAPGSGRLVVRTGRLAVEKTIAVGAAAPARVSALASRGSFWKRVFYPGEPPLASSTPVRSVEVLYPAARLGAFGLGVHWLVAYFVLSLVFGFALKGVFKVEI